MSDLFMSRMGPHLEAMIGFRNSLGYSETAHLHHCKNLDRFYQKYYPEEDHLSEEIALRWMKRRGRETPITLKIRADFIRTLGRYLVSVGEDAYVVIRQIRRYAIRQIKCAHITDPAVPGSRLSDAVPPHCFIYTGNPADYFVIICGISAVSQECCR